MKKEIFVTKKRINRIINIILHIYIIDIADRYLTQLEIDKGKDIPEFILNYLDNSVFLIKKKIKIEKYKKRINNFTFEQQNEFKIFLTKDTKYKELVEELNLIFNFIENEKLKTDFFELLYNLFLEWKNKELKNNKSLKINTNNNKIKSFIKNNIKNTNNNIFQFNL